MLPCHWSVLRLLYSTNQTFDCGIYANVTLCSSLTVSNFPVFQSGHVCGDDLDLMDGKPTGAVRVSFGYMSTLDDAKKCLQFMVDCFLEIHPKPVFWDCKKTENQSMPENSTVLDCALSSTKERLFEELACLHVDSSKVDDTVVHLDDFEVVPEKHETEHLKDGARHKKQQCNEGNKGLVLDEISSCDVEMEDMPMFSPCEGRHLTDIFLYPVKSCAAFKVILIMWKIIIM